MGNFRTLIDSWTPGWLKGYWGTRFIGMLTLFTDAISVGSSEAVRAPWLKEDTSPDDGLPLKGTEYLLERYPAENAAQYRARLELRWETWAFAGSEDSIVGQLAAAGYPGSQIEFREGATGPRGEAPPYWSQFWVFFPYGSHPVLEASPKWNAFAWNDGTTWGPATIPRDFIETVRRIVAKFKPCDWICRGFVFQFEQPKWNAFVWNDGTRWNGAIEVKN